MRFNVAGEHDEMLPTPENPINRDSDLVGIVRLLHHSVIIYFIFTSTQPLIIHMETNLANYSVYIEV